MPLQTAKEVIGACVTPAKYAHAAMAAMTGRWGPVSMMSVHEGSEAGANGDGRRKDASRDAGPEGEPRRDRLEQEEEARGLDAGCEGAGLVGEPLKLGDKHRASLPEAAPPRLSARPKASRGEGEAARASEMAYGAKQPYASSSRLTCTPSSSPTAHRPPSRPDGMATSGTTHRISYSFRSSRS